MQHAQRRSPLREVIAGDQITRAHDDVVGAKVRYRHVTDTSTFAD